MLDKIIGGNAIDSIVLNDILPEGGLWDEHVHQIIGAIAARRRKIRFNVDMPLLVMLHHLCAGATPPAKPNDITRLFGQHAESSRRAYRDRLNTLKDAERRAAKRRLQQEKEEREAFEREKKFQLISNGLGFLALKEGDSDDQTGEAVAKNKDEAMAPEIWVCPTCSLKNDAADARCVSCDSSNPAGEKKVAEGKAAEADEKKGSSSGGGGQGSQQGQGSPLLANGSSDQQQKRVIRR